MLTSLHSIRKAAVGAVGAGMVTGAMLFAGTPIAQAAPPPAPGTSFEMSGPHGAPGVPLRGGGGRGGGWGGHGGGWGGHRGGWGGHPGWGNGGWGNGGWGPPGLGYRPWWNWWR
jgi:hypothetical protein